MTTIVTYYICVIGHRISHRNTVKNRIAKKKSDTNQSITVRINILWNFAARHGNGLIFASRNLHCFRWNACQLNAVRLLCGEMQYLSFACIAAGIWGWSMWPSPMCMHTHTRADSQSVHFPLIRMQRTDVLAIQLALFTRIAKHSYTFRCNNIHDTPDWCYMFFFFATIERACALRTLVFAIGNVFVLK